MQGYNPLIRFIDIIRWLCKIMFLKSINLFKMTSQEEFKKQSELDEIMANADTSLSERELQDRGFQPESYGLKAEEDGMRLYLRLKALSATSIKFAITGGDTYCILWVERIELS